MKVAFSLLGGNESERRDHPSCLEGIVRECGSVALWQWIARAFRPRDDKMRSIQRRANRSVW